MNENNKDAYVRVVCRHKGFSNITDLDKETKNYKLQTIIDKNCEIIYQRHNPTVYFEDLKTKRFTGFNLKWEYCFSSNDTKYMKTFSNLYTVKKSKYFIAIANMVYEANISKHKQIWVLASDRPPANLATRCEAKKLLLQHELSPLYIRT